MPKFMIDMVSLPISKTRKIVRTESPNAFNLTERVSENPTPSDVAKFLNSPNPSHLRYKATTGSTWCNKYLIDFMHQLGIYLPMVWWYGSVNKVGEDVMPKYEVNVAEQTANRLYDWIVKHGERFGWEIVATEKELQDKVNSGDYTGAIFGFNKGGIGHVSAVIADHLPFDANKGLFQSQAGRKNFLFFHSTWYRQFKQVKFAVHKLNK